MLLKITVASAAAALLLGLGETASAGSMRCGVSLIDDTSRNGPGKYEVLKKCGEPTTRYGNTWVYDRGGRKTEVRFDDAGRIIQISGG